MRICVYSGLDINGQAAILCRTINEQNSPHSATNIISQQTYLSYPYDSIVPVSEFAAYAREQDFDFYILRWLPSDYIYSLATLGIIGQENCIVRLHGSEVRAYPYRYFGLWSHSGITMVSNGYDYHLNRNLGSVLQHIPPMMDCDLLWKQVLDAKTLQRDRFVIGHAPTDPNKKGTKYLQAAVKNMQDSGLYVDLKLITGKPWIEAVREKAQCHAIFDQISGDIGIGTFGVNLLEALAQSKPVLGDAHKFTYSMYPSLRRCMIHVTKENLEFALRTLYANGRMWKDSGLHLNTEGWDFAYRTFDRRVVAQQWLDLMEFIFEGGGGA